MSSGVPLFVSRCKRVLNILGMDRVLPSGLGIAPVDRLSSFVPFGGVLGCKTKEAFAVTRLTVGVSNEVQMVRNLTGSLSVVNQGRMASLGPI